MELPICSYHYGTGMHTQHIVTAKHVENISVTTARDSSTPTFPKYYIIPRAYKRRGHATVQEQKPNGRRNVTGRVQ